MANLSFHTRSATSLYVGRAGDSLMVVLFASICFATYFCFGNERFYQENALFELGQNLLLLCGVGTFYAATRFSEDAICKAIMRGLTLLCASMLLREIDVHGTTLEPYLRTLSEHRIAYLVLLLFWTVLLVSIIREFDTIWRNAVQWLFSRPGAWLIAGIVFYIVGDMAENNLFTDSDDLAKMVEESAELLGTLFVFSAGYISLRRQARLTNPLQRPSPDGGQ